MTSTLARSCPGGAIDVGTGDRDSATERSGPAVTRVAFTTKDLPPSEQFEAYHDYCAPVVDILPSETSRSGYGATCEMWMLGRLALRRIHAPAGSFSRNAAQVRADGLDHWVLNLARHGRQEAHGAAGTLRTGAGTLSVFSLAGAYDARRTNIDWLGLFVPRGAFPAIDAAFHHDRHIALDNALGRLFATYLTSLADELPCMAAGDIPRVIEATQAMVSACIVPSPLPLDTGDTLLDVPRLRRIRDIIDRNLGSWAFHTGRLCRLAGVSRSNLYRMFEPYGGVAHYIQRQRLRRAHDLLADPNCTRKIGTIANDYCFADASTFSRAFRHEFGYAPSDVRKWAGSGGVVLPSIRSSQPTGTRGTWGMLYEI
jgi:AraC-like DNA-binding protein